MSKSLSTLVNQNTFATLLKTFLPSMNTGWKSSVICFTLCLYSKILVSANIVAADQRVNLCEPPYHRFTYDVNLYMNIAEWVWGNRKL